MERCGHCGAQPNPLGLVVNGVVRETQVMCNRCGSRGPRAKSETEAIAWWDLHQAGINDARIGAKP